MGVRKTVNTCFFVIAVFMIILFSCKGISVNTMLKYQVNELDVSANLKRAIQKPSGEVWVYGEILLENNNADERMLNLERLHLSANDKFESSKLYIDSVASFLITDYLIKPISKDRFKVYWIFPKITDVKDIDFQLIYK